MRKVLFLSLLFILPAFADDEVVVNPAESVSPLEFFTRISGRYQVELAAGEKPHAGTDIGEVIIDGNDGIMSFSVCMPNGCDPNDQYFPLDKVSIKKIAVSDKAVSYELSFKEEDTVRKFSWDEVGDKILLKNYQYRMNDKFVTLEHQLSKKVDEVSGTNTPE